MAVARLQLREFFILQAHHLHILARLLAADKPVFANILNIPTKPVWLSIFTLMAASPAVGACYVHGVQNRLANLCALDKIQGDIMMCFHTDAMSERESLKGMPWFLLQGISL